MRTIKIPTPLTGKALTVFSTRFQQIPSRFDRVKIAAHLWRYNDRRGLDYLRSTLTADRDLQSATALVLFRDSKSLDRILEVLVNAVFVNSKLKSADQSVIPSALLKGLAEWPDARAAEAMSKICHYMPNDPIILLAAAGQEREDCGNLVGLARSGGQVQDADERETLRLAADVAWCRLNPKENLEDALIADLKFSSTIENPRLAQMLVFCTVAKPLSAVPICRACVLSVFGGTHDILLPAHVSTGVLASECLIQIDPGSAHFVLGVIDNGAVLPKLDDGQAIRLRKALRMAPGVEGVFTRWKGSEWERNQVEILKLPSLPRYMSEISEESFTALVPDSQTNPHPLARVPVGNTGNPNRRP